MEANKPKSQPITPKEKEDLKAFIANVHKHPGIVSDLQKEAHHMFKDIAHGMSYAEIRARYG